MMGESFEQRRNKLYPIKSRDAHVSSGRHDIYGRARWQKVRARALAAHPVCPDPFAYHISRIVPSVEVHHIVPLDSGGDPYNMTNLIALCRSCHKLADNLDKKDPERQRAMMLGLNHKSRD